MKDDKPVLTKVDYHIYKHDPQHRVIPALVIKIGKKTTEILTYDELTNKLVRRRIFSTSLTPRTTRYGPLDDMNEGQYQ